MEISLRNLHTAFSYALSWRVATLVAFSIRPR